MAWLMQAFSNAHARRSALAELETSMLSSTSVANRQTQINVIPLLYMSLNRLIVTELT